jgi:energy-coupling factor transporter ATP-binding protein EcfA2
MDKNDGSATHFELRLDELRNATALGPKRSLHHPETLRVLALIRAHVSALADLPQASSSARASERQLLHQHEGILVHGPRGSGKTTLLLTVTAALEEGSTVGTEWRNELETPKAPAPRDWHKQVTVLPSLDPTLVEGEEVFLATVAANILRRLNDHSTQPGGYPDADQPELERTLERLARGFRVLMPEATKQDLVKATSDTGLFAERLLDNAMGGLDLAVCFQRFCIEACRVLGVKALVQPIDDADVSINEGWSVLETVRRYLSNGRILPLMLGDLPLFDLVVRDQQWKRLTHMVAAVEAGVAGEPRDLQSLVRDLSAQYLLKLLRPERRIELPDADVRLRAVLKSAETVTVMRNTEAPKELKTLLESAAQVLLGFPKHVGGEPAYRLLSANMRELRHALAWLAESVSDAGATPASATSTMEGFRALYWGSLSELPEAVRPLVRVTTGDLSPWQGWLARQADPVAFWQLDQASDFLGATRKAVARVQTVASMSLTARWRQAPVSQLRYFGSILSPMTAWEDLPKEEEGTEGPGRAWVRRLRLGRAEPAWLTAARVTVGLIPVGDLYASNNVLFFGGATRLPPKTYYRKSELLGRLLSELDKGRGNKKGWLGISAWVNALKKDMDQHAPPMKRQSSPVADRLLPSLGHWRNSLASDNTDAHVVLNWFLSVPRLYSWRYDLIDPWKGVAALGDLAAAVEGQPPGPERREVLAYAVQTLIHRSETLTIAVHDKAVKADRGVPESLDELAEPGEDAVEPSENLVCSMDAWLAGWSKSKALLPASAWAVVAERFAENLYSIRHELHPVEHSAGADLERWVLAFLHQLLMVEAELHGKAPTARGMTFDPKNNNRARNKSGEIKGPFSTNLKRVEVAELPVFYELARCPMLVAVLSREWREELQDSLNRGLDLTEGEELWEPKASLFEIDTDIHTALCALVPRVNSSAGKKAAAGPTNLKELDIAARKFLELPTPDPSTDDAETLEPDDDGDEAS